MIGVPGRSREILVVAHYFPPEAGAASARVAAVVNKFVADGHRVTVLTGMPNFPNGVVQEPYRRRWHVSERDGALRIERVWTYANPRLSRLDRLMNWVSVAAGSVAWLLLHRPRFDFLYVSVPPITVPLTGLVAHALSGATFVTDVRDLMPERGTQLGVWRSDSLAARLMGAFMGMYYRRADLVSTLNETCRNHILARGADPEKVIIFANGFDAIDAAVAPPYERKPGEFVVSYVGNISHTSGVEVVIDAAALLKDDPKYRFLIVGGGNERARLEARVAAEGLTNVTMLGPRSQAEAIAAQSLSDACVIPLRREVLDTIPKKLYDAMGLGRPIILCAGGEAERFVEASGGGIVIEPENASKLAETIRAAAAMPERLAALGERGRAYIAEQYERSKLVDVYTRHLAALMA